MPKGMAALVMTRSSSPNGKYSIDPTLIDCNYQNEISTIVSNFTNHDVEIKKGQRLAQLVLFDVYHFCNEEGIVETLGVDRPPHSKHGSSDEYIQKSQN